MKERAACVEDDEVELRFGIEKVLLAWPFFAGPYEGCKSGSRDVHGVVHVPGFDLATAFSVGDADGELDALHSMGAAPVIVRVSLERHTLSRGVRSRRNTAPRRARPGPLWGRRGCRSAPRRRTATREASRGPELARRTGSSACFLCATIARDVRRLACRVGLGANDVAQIAVLAELGGALHPWAEAALDRVLEGLRRHGLVRRR